MISPLMNEHVDEAAGASPDRVGAGSLGELVHELRQPLVVAVGYVSMLEDDSFGELPAEVKSVLSTIAGRLDAMNGIIDRIAARA